MRFQYTSARIRYSRQKETKGKEKEPYITQRENVMVFLYSKTL